MTPATSTFWELRDVRLDGDRQPRLWVDHLEIGDGHTAILGPSGAGKTSLLNLLVAYEHTDLGQVHCHIPRSGTRLPLFWVPSDGGLWPQASVAEHLRSVLPPESSPDRTGILLEMFDLVERTDARPAELSAGESSRLSTARGLAAGARVLVADEPLVHVDPARLACYWSEMIEDCHRENTSLIFSTHAPEQALRHADRVIGLCEGRMIADGNTQELYRTPPSREAAECLGPVNWFTAEQALAWELATEETEFGIRPRDLLVIPDESGPVEIVSSREVGATRETRLRLLSNQAPRTVTHLADTPAPVEHQRIRLKRRNV